MSTASYAAGTHWRAMADQDTYYALRDGARQFRDKCALKTLRPRMDGASLDASDWLVAQFEAAAGISKGASERVDGGARNGAETALISRTDGARASEAAVHAVTIRSMVRNAGPILRATHDRDNALMTVAEIARWQGLGQETAARAILSVIATLAAYRADVQAECRAWNAERAA